MSGCSQSDSNEFSYDLSGDASQGENSIYTVELDTVENTITAINKVTGETILLTRDPFDQYGSIASIYVGENSCYYTTQGNVGDGFQIYKIFRPTGYETVVVSDTTQVQSLEYKNGRIIYKLKSISENLTITVKRYIQPRDWALRAD